MADLMGYGVDYQGQIITHVSQVKHQDNNALFAVANLVRLGHTNV